MEAFVKVILVTGGSSGLGRAICDRLAALGHTVYGTSRQVGSAQGWTLLPMDVTDETSVRSAVSTILEREGRIDVLVNNAGQGIQGPVEDTPPGMAMNVLDTNLLGPHRVARAVLPTMRAQGSGLIIQISSIAANFGLPFRGFYSASKAALDRLTESMRMELAPFGIHVVTVQPGEFKTRIADSRLRPDTISEAYRIAYERCMTVLGGSMHYGRDPDELARMVARLVANPRPKPLVRVAQGVQKLSVGLKKLLPTRLFERMVSRHYA